MFKFPKDFPQHSKVILTEDHKSIYTFDKTEYIVSFVLANADGFFEIPNNNMVKFVWEESLLGFKQTAVLTYDNPSLSSHRLLSTVLKKTGEDCPIPPEKDVPTMDFVYHNDGSDVLHVKIMPVTRAKGDDKQPPIHPVFGSNLLMHTFAITKVEDDGSVFDKKKTTLYLEGIESFVLRNPDPLFKSGYAGRDKDSTLPDGKIKYPPLNTPIDLSKHSADFTSDAIYDILWNQYNEFDMESPLWLSRMLPRMEGFNPSYYNGRVWGKSEEEEKKIARARKYGKAFLHTVYGGDWSSEEELEDLYRIYKKTEEVKQQKALEQLTKPKKQLSIKQRMALEKSETKNKKPVAVVGSGVVWENKKTSDVWDEGAKGSYIHLQLSKVETSYSLVNRLVGLHTSGVPITVGGKLMVSFDPCILRLERPLDETKMGMLTLRPYISYFENAFNLSQRPESIMGGFMGEINLSPTAEENTTTKFTKSFGAMASKMASCNMASDTAMSVDNITSFNFDIMTNTDYKRHIRDHEVLVLAIAKPTRTNYPVGAAFEYVTNAYITPILTENGRKDAIGYINLRTPIGGNSTTLPLSTKTIYPTKCATIALGRNRLIGSIVFLNDMLTFETVGNTSRTVGRFFNANLPQELVNSDEAVARLVGMYFAVSVIHDFNFKTGKYSNVVSGTKQYSNLTPQTPVKPNK